MGFLLFYSERCPYSKTILDEIRRRSGEQEIKTVSVESIYAEGKRVPTSIHSVPALMVMNTKQIYFGRQVFDFLFLPGTGYLMNKKGGIPGSQGPSASGSANTGPQAYMMGAQYSDQFTFIEEGQENPVLQDISYAWGTIQEAPNNNIPFSIDSEETRSKKSLPNIDEYRSTRDADLQNYLNRASLPPL